MCPLLIFGREFAYDIAVTPSHAAFPRFGRFWKYSHSDSHTGRTPNSRTWPTNCYTGKVPIPQILRPFRFTFQCTGLKNKDIRYFRKEKRNELFSPAERTSGGFDCGHFDPDSAKALELRGRFLPHNNRNTRVDPWPLVPLILHAPLNSRVYQPPALSLPPDSLRCIIPHPTNCLFSTFFEQSMTPTKPKSWKHSPPRTFSARLCRPRSSTPFSS